MKHFSTRILARTSVVIAVSAGFLQIPIGAQDRLKTMPGYAGFEKMAREIPTAVRSGALNVTWKDPQTFEYTRDGKRYRYDVATKSATEIAAAPAQESGGRGGRGGGPARGRQVDASESPNGRLKAFYRDRNLWLGNGAGGNEVAITTDGSDKERNLRAVHVTALPRVRHAS